MINAYAAPIYKISRSSNEPKLESWVLGVHSDRDQFFFSRNINTSYWSFRGQTEKDLQIWAAIVKLTLYSYFVPCFSSTVWFIIVSVMLYASSSLPIFPVSRIRVYIHGNTSLMVYFSFLNEAFNAPSGIVQGF